MAEIWERGDTAGLIGFAVYFVIFAIALDRIFDAVARHVFRWPPHHRPRAPPSRRLRRPVHSRA